MASPNPTVILETSKGTMKAELYADKAPITVANFLGYVKDGFFDGTIFHRVIPGFMVQGGGFQPGMKEKKTKANIKNESSNGLANRRGTLAMARTSAPDSASSQFFINAKDNAFLDRANAQDRVGYCVFGKVTEGLDVLDQIEKVPTGNRGGHGDVPVQDVVLLSVREED
jgi:peptidyl-prolyl cis-trans isomerase B (cyclophilin B)